MSSISKRQSGIDRISNLPNNLITHILSFLSTEDAVRTSALSTHWNQQWTLTAKIDIDDGLQFKENSNSRLKRNLTPRSKTSFVNFVYRVLLLKVTRLDLFRLTVAHDYGVTNVSQWLSAALARNVREIYLMAPLVGHCLGHDCLFSSRTLVVLTLGLGFLLRVPNIVSLESLKVLHLNQIQFEDGESLSRLVSSCIVLEELKIEGELSRSVNVLNISSPVLKYLILISLYSDSEDDGAHSYEVVLNTPRLEYLEHNDDGVPDGYHIESTLRCLDRAWLSLYLCITQFYEYDDPLILAQSMADLAVAISNVRFLYLSDNAFWAFYRPDCALPNFQLPNFPRLTNLSIGAIIIQAGLSLLIAFLQNSPQLESLSFAVNNELDDLESWNPPTDVPFCMLYNLKVIEVVFIDEPEPLLSMIKYFLEKANCLEEFIIPCMDNEEFFKEVSLFPRASKSCKIVLG